MKVDIWSDIRCPFCYIGKRKFELALERFAHREKVEVIWHSFELDPGLQTQPNLPVYDYLARIKGISREQAVEMHDHVIEVAAEVGLSFHFDKAVVANSFNAHRLIQLAKTKDLGDVAEECLFKAHFMKGKNIDDVDTLLEIGKEIGLSQEDVQKLLSSRDFAEAVKEDEMAARSIGIRGVPFFIFNNKYAVSGAQAPDLFHQTLEKAWSEFEKPDVVATR